MGKALMALALAGLVAVGLAALAPGHAGSRIPAGAIGSAIDAEPAFSECFVTGTAAEVTPVAEIGPYRFAVGDITRKLMDDYAALIRPANAVAAAG